MSPKDIAQANKKLKESKNELLKIAQERKVSNKLRLGENRSIRRKKVEKCKTI
jgi:hypothetical protein